MAEKEKLNLGDEKPTKSFKGLIFAVVGTVIVVLTATFVTLYFLGIFPPKATGSGSHAKGGAETKQVEEVKPPIYMALKPAFAANFKGNLEVSVVQVEITLASTDQSILDTVTKHAPMVRNNLLLLLSSQDPIVLKTTEGKEAFRSQIKESINKVVTEKSDKKTGVDEVFFTGFVMQ